MNIKFTLLLFILLFFEAFDSYGQLNTSGYRVDQSCDDVEVCQGSTDGSYTITAKTSTLNNFQITLAMPVGISYVAGTASIAGGAYTVSEINISDLRNPVFAINNGGVPATLWGVGDQVVFTVARIASCPSVAHALAGKAFKDSIAISYEDNNIAEFGADNDTTYGIYNIDFASLSILAIANINTTLNTTETRAVTVRQGGNSCIQQFQHFVIVGRDINNYQLSFGGTNLVPTSIVANATSTADTLFYDINLSAVPFLGAVGNGDNCFDNGEDIVFSESLSATACNEVTINHHARWGCTSLEYCQAAIPQVGPVTFGGGAPSLSLVEVGGATAPELCDTINHTVRITNTASPTSPAGGSIAFDVAIVFGLGSNSTALATPANNTLWGSDRRDTRYWGGFNIGGNAVVDSALAYGSASLGTASFLIQDRLTFDPDGPGGLEDLDNDGFFDDLAPGASFEISFDYWVDIRDNCGSSNYYNYMTWEHKYFDVSFKDQCKLDRAPVRRDLGYRNIIRNYLNSTFIATPSDVFDGQDFVVGIMPHFYNNGYLCRGENMFTGSEVKWSISLTLPSGVDTSNMVSTIANLDSELLPYNPTVTKVGNVVTYTLDRYRYDTLHFSLNFDCLAYTDSVILNIPYTSHYFCGTPGDTCFYREVHCGTLTNMLTHCPSSCNGPVIYAFDASRTTAGYTDATRTTLVTLDPATHRTKFYNPYDTMLVQANAYIKDTAIGNFFLTLNLTPTSGGTDFLTFVGGEILINDISSGTGFQSFVLDAMPVNLTNIAGQNYQYTMDLSRYADSVSSTYLFGGEDGSNIYTTDTVMIRARFVMGENFAASSVQAINPFRASFSTILSNGNSIACDSLGDIGQYEKVSFGWGAGAYSFGLCSEGLARMHFTHSAFTGDDHPNEYRPPTHWDSVKFVIPNYRYTGNRFSWANASGFTILPNQINGDTVTMYRPTASYTDRDKRGTYYPAFLVAIRGNCETPANQTLRAWNYYKEFAYHPDSTVHVPRVRSGTTTLRYTAPTWSFQALTPSVNGTQDTVSWDVELCNTTSNADIGFNWLTIPAHPDIKIESMYNITTGVEVAVAYTESNDSIIVELGAANRNTCEQYRFYATYNNCANQAITLNHGWDCDSYPADYEALTSTCYRTVDLLLEPRPSEVQVNILSQVTTPQDLCTDTTYVIEISSAQLADLKDPVLTIRGITGVSFSAIRVEYPRNSGNIEVLTPAIVANLANVNLSDHTGIAANDNSLRGTGNAAINEERFVTVYLDLQFTCSFSPNSSMSFSVQGSQPCGNIAVGSGVRVKSDQIEIDGAVAPYNAYTGTTVLPSPIVVQNCATMTTIRIQTTIIGDTTTSNDTTEVFLPLGTTYEPGTYTCNSSSCPTGVALDTINGRPRLVFPYPSGITSGSTLDYTFGIVGSTGFCSNNEELEVNSYVIAGNINCLGVPCGPVKLITGEADEVAIIEKPDLVISNLSGSSYNHDTAQTYTLFQQITNTGLDAPAGTVIGYFCVDAVGNAIGSEIGFDTIPDPINNGQTIQAATSFSASTSYPCTNTSGLAAMINPSSTQCICTERATSFTALLLPLQFMSFEAELIGERKALLTWVTEEENDNVTFELEKAVSNRNSGLTYEKIATVNGSSAKEYSHTQPNLVRGTHYFRIKTIELDGTITYSPIKALIVQPQNYVIAVYPNPSEGTVWIDVTDHVSAEKINIEVFNNIGQKVSTHSSNNETKIKLDLSHLPNGSYIIKMSSSSIQKNIKLTIARS
ncbi:MAG: CHU domain-containing protein [uncultured Aureispira sp.]|uniref:CHU domain-containing protein n=1 Tax=uncultured Aureispira sp. TaxID=1331704 RepID=A0A6S6T923_9BACT|nr:MAG: CHU domain-containing protein [uncultured Aureispira sp.]